MSFCLEEIGVSSRLLLGTARYPSLQVLKDAVKQSHCGMVTVSLRREGVLGQEFYDMLKSLAVAILPNTASCVTAKEAITVAMMAREIFATPYVKLEIVTDEETLFPSGTALIEATKELVQQGFKVLPYCSDDISICDELLAAGCVGLMPLAALIGTGKGVRLPEQIKLLRHRYPETTLIIDAGIGAPSHAAFAMELGADAVLLNTAVATADDPVLMAMAFAQAIAAGKMGYDAGLMPMRENPIASTPWQGRPFV